MPRVAQVDGVSIRIYFHDTDRHKTPHFHAVTAEDQALFAIPGIDLLEGGLPQPAYARVCAWARANRDLLITEWNRCNPQQPVAPSRKAD